MDKELAKLGLQMREAQKAYFKFSGMYSKTGYPQHLRAKREALQRSKSLERKFDDKCKRLLEFGDQQALFE